jgi:hypothetical protein
MINIIPINNDLFSNKDISKVNTRSIYCIDLKLITLLMSIDNYPQKKYLSIEKLLQFIQWFETNMNDENSMSIPALSLKSRINKHYKRYMDILSDNKIITPIKNNSGRYYQTGIETKKYRLLDIWTKDNDLCLVYFESNDRNIDVYIDENLNIDKRMIYTVTNKLKIDYTSALKAEILNWQEKGFTTARLRKRLSKLFSSKDYRYIKKGYKVDRIYHSFSNISKISREYLNIPMCNIDLKNSQPLFLVAYIIENGKDYDISYKNDCESGEIYLNFYNVRKEDFSNDSDELRSNVKKAIYKNIFFGFNENSLYNKRFKQLYPRVWQYLKDINDSGETLASILQNKEALLFNNLNPKKSKYYFTLFDAIYYSDKNDTINILDNINTFFSNLGIKVQTEIKIIN